MQKAKWFSEEALQIAEKRREAKGKGEREKELKSLLMKVKEKSENVDSTFRKRRSWHLVPSLPGKQMGKQRKE